MAQLLLQEASQLRVENMPPSWIEKDREGEVELLRECGTRKTLCPYCKYKWREYAHRTTSVPSDVDPLMTSECRGTYTQNHPSGAQLSQCRLQAIRTSTAGHCTTLTITNPVQRRHQVTGEGNKKCTLRNHCRISTAHHRSSLHLRTVTQTLLHIVLFLALFTHASNAANIERTEAGSRLPSRFLNWDPLHIRTVELSKTTPNVQTQATPNLVTGSRGIPNRVAVVGRLFRFQIPPTAFSGIAFQYKANEAGLTTLPDWLHFNGTSGVFTGIPLPSNVGRVYVSVEARQQGATGDSTADSSVVVESDLFMLKVQLPSSAFAEAPTTDDTQTPFQKRSKSRSDTTYPHSIPNCPQGTLLHFPNTTATNPKSSLCRKKPLVLANLLFLVNFTLLTPVQRVELFTKAAQLLCVSPGTLFLRSIDWSDKSGMLLWTQIADSDFADYFSFSTILSFPVTCNSFDPDEEPYATLLTYLESSLLAGRSGVILSDEQDNRLTVEYEQWFVSTDSTVNLQSKLQPEHHRYRRQVQDVLEISMDATATVREVISSTPFVSSSTTSLSSSMISLSSSTTSLSDSRTSSTTSLSSSATSLSSSTASLSSSATSLSSSATSLTTSMTRVRSSSSEISPSGLELPSRSPPSSLIVPPTRVIPTSEASIIFLTRSPTPVATVTSSSPSSVSSQTFEPLTSVPILSIASLPISMISTSIVEVVITPTPSFLFTVRSSIVIPTSPLFSSVPIAETPSPISSSAFLLEPSSIDLASSFLLEPFSSISSEPIASSFVPEPTTSAFFLQSSSSVFVLEPSSTPLPLRPTVSDGILMPMSLSEVTLSLDIFTPTPVPFTSLVFPELTTDVLFPETTVVPMATVPVTTAILPTAQAEITPVFSPTFVSSSSDTSVSTPISLFPTSMPSLPSTTTLVSSQLQDLSPSPSLTTDIVFPETTMVPMTTAPLTTDVLPITEVVITPDFSPMFLTSDTTSASTPILLLPTSMSFLPLPISSQLSSPSPSLSTDIVFPETTMVAMTTVPLTTDVLPITEVGITPVFSPMFESVLTPIFLLPTSMSSFPLTTTLVSSQLLSPSPSSAPSTPPPSPTITPTPSSSEVSFDFSSPLFDLSSSFIFADSPTPIQTFLVPLPTSDLTLSVSMFTPSQSPPMPTETFSAASSALLPEPSTEVFLPTETLLPPMSTTPVFEFTTTQLPLTTSAIFDQIVTSIFFVPTSTLEFPITLSPTPVPMLTPVPTPSICEAVVCENGVCIDLGNDSRCDCFQGWTDEFCQTDADDCEPRPLGLCDIIGSSNCSDGNATYNCTCRPGFTGMNCSEDFDECAAMPCLNGATCVNFPAPVFFTCNCPPGYSGPECSVDVSPCDPDPCPSDEICIELGPGGMNYSCFAIDVTTIIDVPSSSPISPSSSPPSSLIAPTTRVIPASEASSILLTRSPTPVATISSSVGIFDTTSVVEVVVTPTPSPSSSPSPSPSPSPTSPPVDNTAPQLLNRIGTVVTNEGQLFRFKIPDNTFYDAESGSLSNLSLTLLDSNGIPLRNTSWIQLSQDVIEGIPLAEQIQANAITEYVFLLRAEDRFGAAAHDFVTVRVFPQGQLENFLNVFFEGNFAVFNQNLSAKLDLVTRIATDPSITNGVYVKEFRNGSIIVSYANLSISDFDCADFRAWVATIYVNGNYTEQFTRSVFPFQPTSTPIIEGPCNTSTSNIDPTLGSTVEIDGTFQSNLIILLAILVPTAVIALVCLLIGIAAVLLYHRRRSERKLILTPMDRTFLNRGPVVLSGEAELPYRSRRPVILPTEVQVGGHRHRPTALEEMEHSLASEDDSSSEEDLFISPRSRLLPPGSPPPPYTLPPDYVYPS